VNFLHSLKIKQKPNWSIVYIIALAVVLLLLMFWFSVKPEFLAHDFLPDQTTFYYQWTDKQAWSGQPSPVTIFDNQEPTNQLNKLQGLLGEMMANTAEIIWFQTSDSDSDHYLVRLIGGLSKQEVEYLATSIGDYTLSQPNRQILLISPEPELGQTLPEMPIAKFELARKQADVNLYFELDQAPEFLQKLAGYLETVTTNPQIFLSLDLAGRQMMVDLYQPVQVDETADQISWSKVKIPDHRVALAINDLSATADELIQNFILPNLFTELPNFYAVDDLTRQKLSQKVMLVTTEDDDWLLVSQQDWQESIFELIPEFLVTEVSKRLSDGTLYTELVKNKDAQAEILPLGETNYWKIDGLYGAQAEDFYYLSNSEAVIKQIITKSSYIGDSWTDCLLTGQSTVTDWLSLDRDALDKVHINSLFAKDIKQLDVFAYYNHVTRGWRMCFE
jgi:hypothetical protein